MSNRLSRCRPLLGTYVEISLQGELADSQLIELSTQGFAAIEQIQNLMSFHSPASELTRINRYAHIEPQPINKLTYELLSQALLISAQSQGVFDITLGAALVKREMLPDHGFCQSDKPNWQAIQLQPEAVFFTQPLQLDLGGIAKGFAVDKAFEAIVQAAGKLNDLQITINAGGDMRMSHWQGQTVGIRNPERPERIIPVPLKNSALATSADYFLTQEFLTDNALTARAGIYSPHSQTPLLTKRSFSVFANCCTLADALTKVLALMENPAPLFAALQAEAQVL
ncbi:MAG TPA: FAD:protein FMN transferase [Cellvibrionaceae bacterium]